MANNSSEDLTIAISHAISSQMTPPLSNKNHKVDIETNNEKNSEILLDKLSIYQCENIYINDISTAYTCSSSITDPTSIYDTSIFVNRIIAMILLLISSIITELEDNFRQDILTRKHWLDISYTLLSMSTCIFAYSSGRSFIRSRQIFGILLKSWKSNYSNTIRKIISHPILKSIRSLVTSTVLKYVIPGFLLFILIHPISPYISSKFPHWFERAMNTFINFYLDSIDNVIYNLIAILVIIRVTIYPVCITLFEYIYSNDIENSTIHKSNETESLLTSNNFSINSAQFNNIEATPKIKYQAFIFLPNKSLTWKMELIFLLGNLDTFYIDIAQKKCIFESFSIIAKLILGFLSCIGLYFFFINNYTTKPNKTDFFSEYYISICQTLGIVSIIYGSSFISKIRHKLKIEKNSKNRQSLFIFCSIMFHAIAIKKSQFFLEKFVKSPISDMTTISCIFITALLCIEVYSIFLYYLIKLWQYINKKRFLSKISGTLKQ
ncbi:hypothetical protein cand_037530 [Cryptosporidium andersoni]|uniref:Transmembrane protein n=1 Tax=Cryptosporidium andersoni TaxID=117008 RepID=A0A1J4MUK6_9CRYT|nr:hypothetical protein cand_037530 [Cryptosporidium andersoni]